MNALVGVGANATGLSSPNMAQRLAARATIESNARAYTLGKAVPAEVIMKMSKAEETPAPGATDAMDDQLGRDAFLRLLLTQVANQDPLEPVENTEMVAQLAQFSSLEQMNNMVTGLNTLTGNIDQLNFISATGMLGREITGLDIDGELIQGRVDHVQLNGSVVMLTVNDRLVSMAGVQAIRDVAPAETK